MPNMIETLLRIRGTPEKLENLLERYTQATRGLGEGRALSLERIVALGENATREQKEDAWGCRRNLLEGSSDLSTLEDGEVSLRFCTPITLLTVALIELAQLEPELELTGAFIEEIVESCGRFKVAANRLDYFDLRGVFGQSRASRTDPVTRSILAEVMGSEALLEYASV